MEYNFQEIENSFLKEWEENEIFKTKEEERDKYYVLEMFPYPSGKSIWDM